MRALKWIALFMMALVVVLLLVVGYFFATANVSIAAFKASGSQAAANPERFEALKASVEDETFYGTLFGTEKIGEAEDYVFLTYTLRIDNQCLVPIDMIEVQVVPEPTDVLQMGETAVHSLNPKSQGDVTATLLAAKETHGVRELIVTYYVWGVSFTINETYKGEILN